MKVNLLRGPVVVSPDWSVELYRPKGSVYTLEELQAAVGGMIELVPLPAGGLGGEAIMVVNENGISEGLKLNNLASSLAGQPIVGPALICKSGMIE